MAEQNQGNEQKPHSTQIRMDDSKMETTYANICNVSFSREELTLLFGMSKNWHASQKEVVVEMTDRMVLNPYVAKRLALMLNNSVREYESRFGELKLEAETPGQATKA